MWSNIRISWAFARGREDIVRCRADINRSLRLWAIAANLGAILIVLWAIRRDLWAVARFITGKQLFMGYIHTFMGSPISLQNHRVQNHRHK